MKWLIKLLFSAVAVLLGAYLLPGVGVNDFWSALWVALILSLLNATIKPLLIILTIPITILTLGLFLLVINSVIILLADYFIDGFYVEGFWWALLLSLVLSILNSIFSEFQSDKK
ncbi:MAG: phage holin family protein [Cyclobacteriaceae bacterium]